MTSRPPINHELLSLAPLLLDRTPNGVLVTSDDGKIRVLNRPLRRLLPIVPNRFITESSILCPV